MWINAPNLLQNLTLALETSPRVSTRVVTRILSQ